MTILRFDPSDLPEQETLIFVPKFRGLSGNAVFEVQQNENEASLKVHVRMGILLFRNAIDFEAKSQWINKNNNKELVDYCEINHKSGKTKSSSESIRQLRMSQNREQILDPASLLFSLRQNP